MDIYEVLKNIDKKNKSFCEEMENTTNNCLYYNNSIVNYGDVDENGCLEAML